MPSTNVENFTTLYTGSVGTPITPLLPYGNANVENFLQLGTDGGNTVQDIQANGVITANSGIQSLGGLGITSTTGPLRGFANVVAQSPGGGPTSYFIGDGAYISNINVSNIVGTPNFANFAGNVTVSSQPNITSVGTLVNLAVTGNVTSLSGVFNGDGGGLSNITAGNAANANYANYAGDVVNSGQPNITSVGTLISLDVTGNISSLSGIFNGDGSGLSNLNVGNISGNANFANFAGNVTNSAQPNITSVGTLTGLDVNGNITAANITANTGVFTGNGAGLTNLNVSNLSGNANFANFAGNVTNSAQPNITSVGTLTGLNVNGTITAVNFTANTGVFTGNGAGLTNLNVSNLSGNANFANFSGNVTNSAQPNITSVGTLVNLAVTGNVDISDLGNINFANGAILGRNTSIIPFNPTSNIPTIITQNETNDSNLKILSIQTGSITNVAGMTNPQVGQLVINSGSIGRPNAIVSVAAGNNVSGGALFLGSGILYTQDTPNSLTQGFATFGAGRIVSSGNANVINGGSVSANGGLISFRTANTITTTQLNLYAGNANTGGLSNFSVANLNLQSVALHQGEMTVTTGVRDGNIGNITVGRFLIGANNYAAANIQGNVANIAIGNIAPGAGSFMEIRTGGLVCTGFGNVNNVVANNITTQSMLIETGRFSYPAGSNVSNVSVGNLTTGNILLRTGFATNVSAVTGTYTRGNITLNANTILLQTSNSDPNSASQFLFYPNNECSLGNTVRTINFIATGNANSATVNTGTMNATGNVRGNIVVANSQMIVGNGTANANINFNTLPNGGYIDPFKTTSFSFVDYTGSSNFDYDLAFFQSRGTQASPSPVQVGDSVFVFPGVVYTGNGTSVGPDGQPNGWALTSHHMEVLVSELPTGAGNVPGTTLRLGVSNATANNNFYSQIELFANRRVNLPGDTFNSGNMSITGNVSAANVVVNTSGFAKLSTYTAAALTAITGQVGWIAAVTDSAGGGNPNGMIAFWDTTNARWSYIHDNSAV